MHFDTLTIWTIGHSTRTLEECIHLLKIHDIQHLVDVRSIPHSRLYPHFNKEWLLESLPKVHIHYTHLLSLGGYRNGRRGSSTQSKDLSSLNNGWKKAPFRYYADYALTKPFQRGLHELITIAKKARTAIMCSEAVWWRCHRRIIADYLLARAVKVLHIMSPTSTVEAEMTSFATITPEKNVIYPLKFQ